MDDLNLERLDRDSFRRSQKKYARIAWCPLVGLVALAIGGRLFGITAPWGGPIVLLGFALVAASGFLALVGVVLCLWGLYLAEPVKDVLGQTIVAGSLVLLYVLVYVGLSLTNRAPQAVKQSEKGLGT